MMMMMWLCVEETIASLGTDKETTGRDKISNPHGVAYALRILNPKQTCVKENLVTVLIIIAKEILQLVVL